MHLKTIIYTLLLMITLPPQKIIANTTAVPKRNYETTIINTENDQDNNYISIIPRGYQDFVHNTAEKEFLEWFKWWGSAIVICSVSLPILLTNN